MPDTIKVSTVLPATPEQIYRAWLDAREHGLFTRRKATAQKRVGGKFTAWDGYIEGETLEPNKRIVQAWRTTEFPEGSPDSRLEALLEPAKGGTKVTLVHTNIPKGQVADLKQGWVDYYFEPMKAYFGQDSAQKKKAPKG
ncbi:MAG: hypothetical protein EXR47_03975 [Dehalococcoidia bacterium]|nr:hypothetical protein [Dehalococcoidia bacterium]